MPFSEFIGNERVVKALRSMMAADRTPHTLLFSGPRGVGKFTLARMFAQAANCERHADDFCGACDPCRATAALADLPPLVEKGLEERGANPDAATVERVPLILQPHPDVWAIVPDPVRLRNPVVRPVIRVGQLRAVQRAAHFRPGLRRRVFILDGVETMRDDLAGIFLKILEEPPAGATLILVTPNAEALLDTIRSRCLQFHFAPVAVERVEEFLKQRAEWKPAQRRLAAQLSGGSPGMALTLDLEESARLRGELIELVRTAAAGRDWRGMFARTAQLAKDEKESFENLLEMLYSVFNDLVELSHGHGKHVLRNPDFKQELESLSSRTDFDWVERGVRHLNRLHSRLRRNISRQLGLDALAAVLADSGPAAGPAAPGKL